MTSLRFVITLLKLMLEHDPRFRGGRPFPKTGIHPRVKPEGRLFRDHSLARTGGCMVRKIALEEHFLCPGFEDYWQTTVGDVDPAVIGGILARLTDFGDLRLEAMDRA